MRRTVILSFIVLLSSAAFAEAAIRRVRSEYPAIQDAIRDSNDGDVVIVDPGVYYETINFSGKNILLTGTDPNDPKIVAYTVINAGEDGTTVTFENGETPKAVMTGFTIAGGVGTFNNRFTGEIPIFWGGGIYCDRASPTITRNVISGNRPPFKLGQTVEEMQLSYGGGIACIECNPIITNNIIKNNTAYAGGGIMTYVGDAQISNNLIYSNSAVAGGGVVLIEGTLRNNTIVANDASAAGQEGAAGNLYIVFDPSLGQPRVFNNIICNAGSGGGIYWEGEAGNAMTFNNVWNNLPGNYAVLQPPDYMTVIYDGQYSMTGLRGNISQDPLFVNPQRYDYHLQTGSPCINAGDPNFVPAKGETDIDGRARIYAFMIDMGADEYVGYMPPVAYAGLDQHVLQPSQSVTLDGTGSYFYDPCAVVSFQWKQVAGPNVTLDNPQVAKPTFAPPAEGEYRFSLVVSDESNVSGPDEVLVLVRPNQLPVANAGSNRVVPVPGLVALDGTASYDPDPPDRLSYKWTQLKGPQVVLEDATSATPYFACRTEAVYLFELVVSDGFTQSSPCVVQVATVGATTNQQPLNVAFNIAATFHYPDISGNKVVCAAGPQDDYTWDIACKDLKTGQVSSFGTPGIDTQPRLDGDIVVWSGGPLSTGFRVPQNTSIFVRNIASGAQRTLSSHTDTESYSHPAVSGNKVVWLRHRNLDKSNEPSWRNTPYDICGADIKDFDHPVFFAIAAGVGKRDPYPYQSYDRDFDHVIDISGNTVVWEADGDIYGADISNLSRIKVFTVCNHPARQYDPAISGSIVVWTDRRNDAGDIYGADISDLGNIRESQIVSARGTQQQPAVDGSLIAYVEAAELEGAIKVGCLTRKYGLLDVQPYGSPYGTDPAVDGEAVMWLSSASNGIPSGLYIELAYTTDDGSVENVTARKRYDYIQHAINGAAPGDRIVAGKGIYNERINFKGKRLLVGSADPNDLDIVSATVITGGGSLVNFSLGEDPNCVLAGFTITGGNTGICCIKASPTIFGCVVKQNAGPGVKLLDQSNLTITNCSIFSNDGAGIDMRGSQTGRTVKQNYATIANSIIAANRRQGIFGGIPTLSNCTIVKNLLQGVSCARITIANSILCYNDAAKADVQIDSTIASVAYCDVRGGWAGLGNIDQDPCFVSTGYWAHADSLDVSVEPDDPNALWVMGDYHLLSRGWRWDTQQQLWTWDHVTSPCIDTGNPGSPLAQEPLSIPDDPQNKWGQNIRIDMGAYGGTAEAGMPPQGWVPLSDIDNDGIVDFHDFALQTAEDLGLATPPPADLDRDGLVNLADLALFADYWLKKTP